MRLMISCGTVMKRMENVSHECEEDEDNDCDDGGSDTGKVR